jgi:hypothetical protein
MGVDRKCHPIRTSAQPGRRLSSASRVRASCSSQAPPKARSCRMARRDGAHRARIPWHIAAADAAGAGYGRGRYVCQQMTMVVRIILDLLGQSAQRSCLGQGWENETITDTSVTIGEPLPRQRSCSEEREGRIFAALAYGFHSSKESCADHAGAGCNGECRAGTPQTCGATRSQLHRAGQRGGPHVRTCPGARPIAQWTPGLRSDHRRRGLLPAPGASAPRRVVQQ